MNKILAFDQDQSSKVCFNCLNMNATNHFKIYEMGYGSSFDGWSTKVQLCDDCLTEEKKKWFELNVKYETEQDREYDWGKYEYESEIFSWIKSLDVRIRELFYNSYSTGDYAMESQDWIDYELDILSHEKCKEYGRYSYQERTAYETKFPICDKVNIRKWSDGSQGSWCLYGAHGSVTEEGKIETGCNISDECYMCTKFNKRISDNIEIVFPDEEERNFEIEELKEMLKYSLSKLQEYGINYDEIVKN